MTPKNERAHLVEVDPSSKTPDRPRPEPMTRHDATPAFEEQEPTLGDYLSTLREYRSFIAIVASAVLGLGILYLFLAAPIYRSDVVVQVEEKSKGMAGLDDLSSMFSEKTPADTEIEIIRSRSLVGAVVDQLGLTVAARPRSFPIVGSAIARRHEAEEGVSSPVLGLSGYAWGGERITIGRLEVPGRLLDEELRLLVLEAGRFELRGPEQQLLASGEVGKAAGAGVGAARTELFVSELTARPGTQFRVSKRRRDDVIDDLQRELRISEKGKKTGIIIVALEGKDPVRTAAVLDAISTTYLRQNVERKSAEAAKTLEFLETQLPLLKSNLDSAESAFNKYQLKKGSVDLSAETQALLERTVEIEKALSEMDLQRTELRQKFTDSHRTLVALKQKGDQLRAERAAMNVRMKGLPEQELESARFTRDVKVANELYFLLLNKAQELRVMKSGTIGNVRILDSAVVPYEPASPKKLPVVALAAVLGLAAGVGLAFARKAIDQGVDDPEAIEAATGLSIYASVPHSDREAELARRRRPGQSQQVLAAVDPQDLSIESLRSLRTSLQFALAQARNNVVSIGGPSPAVGKSFLSVNLAHVLASTGQRILLVDADLRRGHLHRYFGGERGPGVSELVSGQASVTDVTRRTEWENLEFVATGKRPPNPSELVGSQRFQAFLAEASGKYDLVIVDTPPILAVTDAALIGRHAGVNLLVLRSGRHPMREIAVALKRLAHSGVTVHGAVMNDVSASQGRYGSYGYHYHYEYRSDSKET